MTCSIELVKGGIDVAARRAYLVAHAPSYIATFDAAVARAAAEA